MRKKIMLFLLVFFLLGCSRQDLTLESFIDIGTYNGYLIEENMRGYEEYTYIKKIYYAVNRENAYDIQFIELENDEYAKRFYAINQAELMQNVNNNTYVKNVTRSNYSIYHIENDEKYMLVIRNKNNILYVNAPINYINEIEEFFDELAIDY